VTPLASTARSAVGIEVDEQFASAQQQLETSELGMWVFLLTELLLFSTLFVSALILRVLHPAAVTAAALHLKMWIGGVNTAVLITSSFFMSAAIELSRMGEQRRMVACMRITAGLGAVFLALKGYEYWCDYAEHMTPFFAWRPYVLAGDPAARLFIDLYYIITSLHAVHLTIGIGLILTMAQMASAPGFLARRSNRIAITGLYWHFIDLIWIIVYPTLYVLNR
jgi:cytochrome c oxidase subunit 3